ncbi:MAG: hypothetical protein ACREJ2_02020 [Planctomycetota bacterium]
MARAPARARPGPPVDDDAAVRLAFAFSPTLGRLVHIKEARAGENYLHPDLDLRLAVHPRKGLFRRHHFALTPGSVAERAAAGAAGGEGMAHLNCKLALVHRLQRDGDMTLRLRCVGCGGARIVHLRERVAFDRATWEVPFVGGFRLDVGLLQAGRPVAALEVFDTHAVDAAKRAAFEAAHAADGFCAFELPIQPLPLHPPVAVGLAVPPALCDACRERRAAWLAWAKTCEPAVNFSGWFELPPLDESWLRLAGGWSSRAVRDEALGHVFYWLELHLRLDREVFITALTLHRKKGRLRWRELTLRAAGGRPGGSLAFHLHEAAQEFAAGAIRFRQRLARVEPDQLRRWQAEATAAELRRQGVTAATKYPARAPHASAPTRPAARSATRPADYSTAHPAAHPAAPPRAAPDPRPAPGKLSALENRAPSPSPLSPPPPAPIHATGAKRKLAAWIDRLAHRAADWLEENK